MANKDCTLSDRLRTLRNEHSLTQVQVASLLDIDRNTYAQYELKRRRPSLEILMRIADFYQVSLDFLTGYTDYRPSVTQWLAEHPDQGSAGQPLSRSEIARAYRARNARMVPGRIADADPKD